MLTTIAVLTFCSLIFAFFSQEFFRFFKKIFSIPGVKLVLPLVMASALVELYQSPLHSCLIWLRLKVYKLLNALIHLLGVSEMKIMLTKIMILFAIPIIAIFFNKTLAHRPRHSWQLADSITLILWLIFVMLLTIR